MWFKIITLNINQMKKLYLLLALFLPSYFYSQSLEDAYRFSKTENFSTARSMGVAGAFGAMGADFGSISYNPASLGNYWKGEMVFSLGYQNTETNAGLGNYGNYSNQSNFNFDNIGLVNTWKKVGDNSFIIKSFAFGLNNVASYNYKFDISGNSEGSIFEDSDIVTGLDYSQYQSGLVEKNISNSESGSMKELLFAYGQNHNDKIMWGFSIGIPFINYTTNRYYNEEASNELQQDPDFFFSSLDYETGYSTVGVGLNAKAGIIAKLPQNIRVGLSAHTPTSFRLKDDYYEYFYVNPINGITFSDIDYEGYFDYKLITPWKFIGSAGKIFGNENIGGFINIDAEYLNFGSSKFDLTAYSSYEEDAIYEEELNNEINKKLSSVFNVRFGGELAIKKFRIRAGMAFDESPFKTESEYNPVKVISGGLGFRGNSYYLDVAYLQSTNSYGFSPYTADDITRSPLVNIDKTLGKFTATLGFKF